MLGRNLFTSEGNLRGGLGSGPFMIHQHNGMGMDVRTSGYTLVLQI